MRRNQIGLIGINALKCANKAIRVLGERGKKRIKNNIHGEISLLADIEAENAVIEALGEARFPIRIISEEHDIIDIGKNPKFLGILDGIDGTKEYEREGENKRYGTMLAIFSGICPHYSDYIFSGIMEHPKKRLLYAIKDKGSFIKKGDITHKIKSSNKKSLNKETIVYYHRGLENNFNLNEDYGNLLSKLKASNLKDFYAAQTKYIDISLGKADAALECTKKMNLEIAVGYGLVKEAGGTVVGLDKKDIGQRKYLEFGYKEGDHRTLLVTATKELALNIIDDFCR